MNNIQMFLLKRLFSCCVTDTTIESIDKNDRDSEIVIQLTNINIPVCLIKIIIEYEHEQKNQNQYVNNPNETNTRNYLIDTMYDYSSDILINPGNSRFHV